jgi:hypothetical protein
LASSEAHLSFLIFKRELIFSKVKDNKRLVIE